MAESKSPSYLPGNDPDAVLANQRYQEALDTLTRSLDVRKNRFFDPVLLAMAEGFLSPTQSGSFGESLGNVAKKLGPAEALAAKEEQDIAQQKLAVASKGLELQRLKARDAELARYLGEGAPTPPKPPAGPLAGPQAGEVAGPQAGPLSAAPTAPAPTGPLSAAGEPVAAPSTAPAAGPLTTAPRVIGPQAAPSFSDKPPGFEGVEGIQVAPANPNFITGRNYVLLGRHNPNKPIEELIKEGQEIESKRYRDKESGVLDIATGKYYQYPTGKTVRIQIIGYPGEYDVDERTAARLWFFASNNDSRYHDLAKRIIEGPERPKPEGGAGKPGGKPETPDSTATSAPPGKLRSQQDIALEQKEAEARAKTLGEKAAEKEVSVEDKEASARRIYGSATRVLDYIKQSPNYYGIFARPTVAAAVGNLIKEGMQTPSGTLNLAGFEDSVRKAMPGATQKDIDNVIRAGMELAEIELAYTKLYLDKQGAVTEGERKIVRAIPGTISNSPEVLRTRMELLKARSQYDIDVADAFRQWQDKNPGRSYFEFERKSDMYKQIKKDFEAETEKMFGGIRAVPTRQRVEERSFKPAAATGSLSAAQERVRAELNKK